MRALTVSTSISSPAANRPPARPQARVPPSVNRYLEPVRWLSYPAGRVKARRRAQALRRVAEEAADSPRRQLRLGKEPGGRAFCDQLGIVCFGRGGNQDHAGAVIV